MAPFDSTSFFGSPETQTRILESLPLGIGLVDKNYSIQVFNSKLLELTEVSAENIVGKDVRSLAILESLNWDQLEQQLSSGLALEGESQYFFPGTGREIYFKYKVVPHEGGFLLILQDLTDFKRIQNDVVGYIQKLRLEQSRLSASINAIPVGFMIVDFKNNILIKNDTVDAILGLTDFEGSVFLRGDMVSISDKLREVYDLDVKSEECIRTKNPIKSEDITFDTKTLRIFIGPIILESSEAIGVVILIEDITEAKVLERAKEEFFSIASHELRTPLTSIRGNSSMILEYFKDEIKNPDIKEMLTDIYNASVRLIDMVNDFLNVSRLEQRRIEFRIEDFDIYELTKKVMTQIDNLAREKGLVLRCEGLAGSPVMVRADKNRTEEVFLNLIGNAIKYTEKGEVVVSFERVEEKVLKVRVRDTGRGIPKEQQNLLFRKFQQAGESFYTRDTTKGTGLGLYISKLIVEGMGGTIGLEKSEANVGSVFFFTLPVVV